MANSGFKINKAGIRQFTRELERELAKHPVRIPVEADPNLPWRANVAITNLDCGGLPNRNWPQ